MTNLFRTGLPVVCASAAVSLAQPELPLVTVTEDDTRISESCRVVVPDGVFIEDVAGDGVIQIVADGIIVEFVEGEAELIGVPKGTPWETVEGVGIRVDGQRNVTLRGAHSHRYRVGIWASDADGLVIDGADVAGGYAMRLGSSPEAEDGADWLWPHDNDDHEWLNRYGAGVYVERSDDVTIRGVHARRRQNGIIIDRVNDSRVYDNDCSFLSGWGLAMWRSSRNVISRNAFDFCVRGYSHGVYNRGQDSAGILVFEQCSENLIAENSATHGGDGLFGFAGKEALGERSSEFDVERSGCNDNLIINNDLSYAPAHGLEMTFSFGNRVIGNRMVGNAICGIWGGYSQDTLIAGNLFESNGDMAYGLERGGVNIEHGASNVIRDNVFRSNECGVHLWWDNDEGLLASRWAQANHRGATENSIIRNRFDGDNIAVHLRETTSTGMGGNQFENVAKEVDATPGAEPDAVEVTMELYEAPAYEALGDTRPVGARAGLAGRHNIIMGEYFPWDHVGVLARRTRHDGGVHSYEVLGDVKDFYVVLNGPKAQFRLHEPENDGDPHRVDVFGPAGVHSYRIRLRCEGFERVYEDTLIEAEWDAAFFPWTVDPREDLEGWRAEAESMNARSVRLESLSLDYGFEGPKGMELSDAISQAGPGGDRFGMIASTSLRLPAGRWRVRSRSDDGVRVMVDGETVLENWTWHGPTVDEAEFMIEEERVAAIVVEHFEIDGYSVLELDFEPIAD